MEFNDERGRVWEMFCDTSYYDLWCVRIKDDRNFHSDTSYHFIKLDDAHSFVELLKISR